MNFHRKYSFVILKKLLRRYSTQPKKRPIVTLDESVLNEIELETYKPKKHPGVVDVKNVSLPNYFIKAIENVIEDNPIKQLVSDSEVLVNQLRFRLPPIEADELKEKTKNYQNKILEQSEEVQINSKEDLEKYQQSLKDKLIYQLKRNVYNWTPTNYNEYNSLLYLIARAAPDYAVLLKIFSEIKARDKLFKPRSFFDFGSGIGTGTWAVNNFWKGDIFEYFNVDSSSEMNDLAQLLLQGGRGTSQMPLKGVFYRQFLPATSVPYDLVLSAYTLLELPSLKTRLETVQKLWSKTSKYLILVEFGTNAGFRVINEARDFILQLEDKSSKGHVFSPCPHDHVCPRFLQDDTPCNFIVSYQPLSIKKSNKQKREVYSYVVLKKGNRDHDTPEWPRVVRDTLVRSKHTICRMCTKEGKLQEIVFTASKHGKTAYRCARSTRWGDLLPISINEEEGEK